MLQLEPHYYSFRWITLLFTQEFTFPDALRLWDSIISEERSRMDFVLQICVAMLITIRDQLLEGDFACNLKLLQASRTFLPARSFLYLMQPSCL